MPLYAGDLLPGESRRRLVEAITEDVQDGRNVNLVGARRSGRTSTLNHAWARISADAGCVVARVNMQDDIVDPDAFYGMLLLGTSQSAVGAEVLGRGRAEDLKRDPRASYRDARAVLADLRHQARVVALVDEFEQCFAHFDAFGPDFYNNLRSLLGGDQHAPLLGAVIATREPVAAYIDRLQFTSTLPSYLPPRPLERLTDPDVEEALAQDSPHRLGPFQRDHAARLADHHPCRLQCAGEAWYRALRDGNDGAWVEQEYRRLGEQVCHPVPISTRNAS
jgi:hypothetical protein